MWWRLWWQCYYGGNAHGGAFNDPGIGVPYPPVDPLLTSTLYGIQQFLETQQSAQGQQRFSKAFIQDRTDAHEEFKFFAQALQK